MKLFSLLVLGAVGSMTVATPAFAATASCESDTGSCTISNDAFDSISCGCQFEGEGGSGGGSTGGDSWQGLSEEELLVICFDHLESMCSVGNDTDGGYDDTGYGEVTTTTFGGVTTGFDPSDTHGGDTDGGCDPSATTGIGGQDTGWIPGEDSGPETATDGNWGEDTGWSPGGESGSDGADTFPVTTGASSQGDGQGDDAGEAMGDGGYDDAGEASGDGGYDDAGDSEGSWGSSTSADPTGGSGGNPDFPWQSCSVTPSGRAGSGWMIGLLGLAGFLRRRRRS